MKAFVKCVCIVLLIFATAPLAAAEDERPALSWAHFALKAEYVVFTSSLWKDNDIDQAPLIGLEGYGSVYRNLYMGAEIGYSQATSTVDGVDTELSIIPLEFNLKYAFDIGERFKLDLGGGFSYTWADGKVVSTTITGTKNEGGAWGGQAFVNLQWVFNRFLFGANAKYQTTGEILNDGTLDNFRGGVHVGVLF